MKDKYAVNTSKFNTMRNKHVVKKPYNDKKFAPKVIGNERAALLSDDEMQGMHKFKKPHGLDAKPAVVPHATMLLKSRD